MSDQTQSAAHPTSYAPRACGILKVTGVDRVDLLHRLSTQDLRPLRAPGVVCQTLFTTAQGRTLAWTQVISLPDALLVVCPLPRVARLVQWIETYTIMEDVQVEDVTESWLCFDVFGHKAFEALGLVALSSATATQAFGADSAAGCYMTLFAALGAGLTGVVPKTEWQALHTQLAGADVAMATAAELEQRRIKAGMPSIQYELMGEPNPLEMRLGAACISWKKGCYIGQEVISRLDSYDKVARLLMGFTAPEVLPEPGAKGHKLFVDGRPIGKVTSYVATSEGTEGLALVKRQHAQPGAAEVRASDMVLAVALEDRPFWAPTAP